MKARVVQVIDNLGFGGAESMAVNIANLLHQKGHFSAICATRIGGVNEEKLEVEIPKLLLERKSFFDFNAVRHFLNFCKENQIDIVHPHSSSVFFVLLAKGLGLKAKIVWHDHSGTRVPENAQSKEDFKSLKGGWKMRIYNSMLRRFRSQISHVISVNERLKIWATTDMKMPSEKVTRIDNFPLLLKTTSNNEIDLPGSKENRIVLLANIRKEKSHLFAIQVANVFLAKHPDWHFLFVGKHFADAAYENFEVAIKQSSHSQQLHYLGGRTDVTDILANATIGILTSSIEGLPVVILEYGYSQLPVVSTKVGQVPEVIADAGILIDVGDVEAFAGALIHLAENKAYQKDLGQKLFEKINSTYSPEVVYSKFATIYTNCLKQSK